MCKVLVIDDDTGITEALSEGIKAAGLETKTAENSFEAIKLLRTYKSIRMVVCDLHLPDMDGISLCKLLRKKDPLLIMIAITGYSNIYNLIQCRQAGFDDMLFKPIGTKTVANILLAYNANLERWRTYTQ